MNFNLKKKHGYHTETNQLKTSTVRYNFHPPSLALQLFRIMRHHAGHEAGPKQPMPTVAMKHG